MSAPESLPIRVVRGNPTAQELAAVTAVRPEGAGARVGSTEAVLMTLGDVDRPASWDAFFARHPLPGDAIRERIIASNAATPGDVVCVPLESGTADAACR